MFKVVENLDVCVDKPQQRSHAKINELIHLDKIKKYLPLKIKEANVCPNVGSNKLMPKSNALKLMNNAIQKVNYSNALITVSSCLLKFRFSTLA
jgi:hypothetical protein